MKTHSKINRSIFMMILTAFTSISQAIPSGGEAWIPIFETRSNGVIKVGKPLEVVWAAYNAIGCSLNSNAGGGPVATSGSTFITPVNTGSMSITISCVNHAGSPTSKTRTVQVKSATFPELTHFDVSPSSNLIAGQIINFNWNSEFTNECELTGTDFQVLPTGGSSSYVVSLGSNTLTMTCYNASGTASNSITRYVTGGNPPPIIYQFYINPVNTSNYFVVWDSIADYCVLDFVYTVPADGAQIQNNTGVITNHFLTCHLDNRTESKIITYYPPNPQGGGGGGGGPILDPMDGDE